MTRSHALIGVVLVVLSSCTVPKGDTGPAGPQGAQGQQGTPGATGAPGPTGVPGSMGAAGTMGTAGAMGTPGTMGTMGSPGVNGTSVRVTTAVSGECGGLGGVVVSDADGGHFEVCNGASGIDGAPGATVTVAMLPTGDAVCPTGGVAVTSATGLEKVCNGATGVAGPTGDVGPRGPAGDAGVDGATGAILSARDFDVGWLTPAPTLERIAVGNSFMVYPMWNVANVTNGGELVASVVAPEGVASKVELRLSVFSVAGGSTRPYILVAHQRLGQPLATSSAQLAPAAVTIAAGTFGTFSSTFSPSAPVQPGDVLHLRINNSEPGKASFHLVGATVRFVP